MNRNELLNKLRLVAPALSDNALIPVLTHFWMRDDFLMAYNDQIAISVPLKIDFEGAVPGSLLIELLNSCGSEKVEFSTHADDKSIPEGELLIVAASARLELPFLPVASTDLFEMPVPSKQDAMGLDTANFMAGVETCLRSVREDTSIPDSLGVTIYPGKKSIEMFSTNDATISRAFIDLKSPPKMTKRVVLSAPFCRQMLELAKAAQSDKKAVQLEIHDDYALFSTGSTTLFGKLISVPKPLDFVSILDDHFPPSAEKNMVAIPTMFQNMLDRAVIITESKTGRSKTAISIKKDKVEFFSQSEKGKIQDHCKIDDKHPPVEVTVEPKMLRAGYGAFDKIIFTSRCVVMAKGDMVYMISASAE